MTTLSPEWQSADGRFTIYRGDAATVLASMAADSVDVIDADPPYFLSGGGQTCRGGQRAKVDKGTWDKPLPPEELLAFNARWMEPAQRALKKTGSLWTFGSLHNIFEVGYAAKRLGLRSLNKIEWEKTNPPPNLACRCFTHSTETILWSSKNVKAKHLFDYATMKAVTGKQMKDVWRMAGPQAWETVHGRYPAQKPVALHERMLRASAPADGLVLDPFMGSGSSGVAAARLGLRWIGVDMDADAINLAVKRLEDAIAAGLVGAGCAATVDPCDAGIDAAAVRAALCDLYNELGPEAWLDITATDPLGDVLDALETRTEAAA